jgi:serine protease Do
MPLSKLKPRTIGMFAAGLIAATALTATAMTLPVVPVYAEAIVSSPIDPSKGVADLVDRVMPAVVSVEVKFANAAMPDGQPRMPGQPDMPGLPDNRQFEDFFNQFPQFRQGQPFDRPRPRGDGMAQGSGFIISADGYAVTNNHVVQNAKEVSVKFTDGKELTAEVIGTDPKTDLALVKIKSDEKFQAWRHRDDRNHLGPRPRYRLRAL